MKRMACQWQENSVDTVYWVLYTRVEFSLSLLSPFNNEHLQKQIFILHGNVSAKIANC